MSVSWTVKAHLACKFDICCRENRHTRLKRDRWTFDHMTDTCWLLVICPVNVCTQRLNSQLAFKASASTFKSRWGNLLIVLLYKYLNRRGKTNTQINKTNFFVSFEFHLNSQSPWHTPIPSTHLFKIFTETVYLCIFFLLSIFGQWRLNLPFFKNFLSKLQNWGYWSICSKEAAVLHLRMCSKSKKSSLINSCIAIKRHPECWGKTISAQYGEWRWKKCT